MSDDDESYLYDDEEEEMMNDAPLQQQRVVPLSGRPQSAADRDAANRVMNDADAVRMQTHTVTIPFHGEYTANWLMGKKEVEFSVAKNNIDKEQWTYSHVEDANEALNKLGPCALVESIELDMDSSNMPKARFFAQIDHVPAVKKEGTALRNTTVREGAPYGVIVAPIENRTGTQVLLKREVNPKLLAWIESHPGHTADMVDSTYHIFNNGKAYVQMLPIESPLIDFHDDLPEVEADPSLRLRGQKVDEHGNVTSKNPELLKKAAALAKEALRDNVGFAQVTDPNVFKLIFRAQDRTVDNVKVATDLGRLHIDRVQSNPRFAQHYANAATQPRSGRKVADIEHNSMLKGTNVFSGKLTIRYRQFVPECEIKQ